MLYIPVIEAIEQQLQKHPQLAKIRYYRFSIPSSSVKNPFICTPFTQINEYTSHAHPCIIDTVTNSCVGNYCDLHMLTIPILIGAARHRTFDADEVLDIIQDAAIEQIKLSRSLNGVTRWTEPRLVNVDSFVEISPNNKGALLSLEIKCIDTPDIPDLNYIEELLGPGVEEG